MTAKQRKMRESGNWIKTTHRPWSFLRGIDRGTLMSIVALEGRFKGLKEFAFARCHRNLWTIAHVSIVAVGSNNRFLDRSIA